MKISVLKKISEFIRARAGAGDGESEESTPQQGERPKLEVAERLLKKLALGDIPRYGREPRIVFIGGAKGGAGKSLLSSNLALVLGGFGKREVMAVDLDLDNYTLSWAIEPDEEKVERVLRQQNVMDYMTVASILLRRSIYYDRVSGRRLLILTHRTRVFACNGAQVPVRLKIIPAYNKFRARRQTKLLRNLDFQSFSEGLEVLVDFIRSRDEYVVLDGKQKSNLGTHFDPLYMRTLEVADVFLLVTEPPMLSYEKIVRPFTSHLEKTIIVANKVKRDHARLVDMLIRDATRDGVPVFVIPYSEDDASMFTKFERIPPARVSVKNTTALFTLALAYFLNMLDERRVEIAGCYENVMSILKVYSKYYRR